MQGPEVPLLSSVGSLTEDPGWQGPPGTLSPPSPFWLTPGLCCLLPSGIIGSALLLSQHKVGFPSTPTLEGVTVHFKALPSKQSQIHLMHLLLFSEGLDLGCWSLLWLHLQGADQKARD